MRLQEAAEQLCGNTEDTQVRTACGHSSGATCTVAGA